MHVCVLLREVGLTVKKEAEIIKNVSEVWVITLLISNYISNHHNDLSNAYFESDTILYIDFLIISLFR